MNEKTGLGPSGYCICPKCSYKTRHQRSIPCQEMKCPKCGAKMLREGSVHHNLFLKKREIEN